MRKLIENQYIYLALIFSILFFWYGHCFAAFTVEDEKKLGKEFYNKLIKHNLIIENKRLNEYLAKIGNLILKDNKQMPFEFQFSLVNSSAINAFATPGGYIYINKGLINAIENEGELAAVIAHEIGHANARHIASIIEKSKKINIATIGAILAGALLGGGGEATAAIAAFSMAGAASLSLKYSREHEEEADRMGMEYLVKAGYYPAAMIDFLKIIKKYEYLSKSVPSYLLTHPGTDERIFYMDNLLLTQYPQKGARNIVGNLTRIQALLLPYMDDLNVRHKQLEESLSKDPENVDLLYSLALAKEKLGMLDESLPYYQKALSMAPQDEDVLKSIGLIYLKTGKADLAQSYLLRANTINPNNDEVTLALGWAYDAMGKYKNSLECYLKLENKELENEDINYFIAMAYGKLNNKGESHYYFGLHFKKLKKKNTALFHLKEALNYFPRSSQRVDAINHEIKLLQK